MSRIRLAVAVLLALVGLVWVGQGLGLLPGSFMSNQSIWAIIGAAVLVGAALVARSARGR
jgi:hypothetical protein